MGISRRASPVILVNDMSQKMPVLEVPPAARAGIDFVFVNQGGTYEAANNYIASHNIRSNVLLDPQLAVARVVLRRLPPVARPSRLLCDQEAP